MASVIFAIIGPRANGQIGPSKEQLIPPEALEGLQGDNFVRKTRQFLIGGCADERLDENGQRLLLPPVFGGWFSAVLADAISTHLWYRPGMNVLDHAIAMTISVQALQPESWLCIHTDVHSLHSEICGCAAIAKAAEVLDRLPEFLDVIARKYRENLCQSVAALLNSNYFIADTTNLVNRLEEHNVKKEVLAGNHSGVAFLRNDDDGTIYDRPAFYEWCRKSQIAPLYFFEYSRWSMRRTSRLIMPSLDAAEYFFAAADAFNNLVPFAIENPNAYILDRF